MRRAVTLITLLALIALPVGLAGCGGGEEVSPTPETIVGTIPAATTAEEEPTSTLEGDASNGEKVFASAGCGGCHTFSAAGTNGTVGPNLGEALQGKDAEFVHESIVDPTKEVASGFAPNVMPQDYGQNLSQKQVDDLVAFLTQG